jgi:FKBP-type peptidyl-prolyl cis-trans isomerase
MKRAGAAEKAVSITADGGILKQILVEGSGEPIPSGKLAIVHYTGKLLDGTVFDSSKKRNTPFKFTVGAREVILGWDKGVATMRKGETRFYTQF